jgi:uncharacterized protein
MRLSEVQFGAALPVEGYGPGFFRIGGQPHSAPLVLTGGRIAPWAGYADPAPLLALAGDVDVVFVGTGAQIAHVPPDFRAALEGVGLGVEVMDSPAACRTYNVLLSEGRRIALAVLPVTEPA